MNVTLQRKLPTHEIVYRRMREMVLFGELAPGQSVTIQGLAADMGAGMTPVRESIRRLTAEGALEFMGNRRVCVPKLTLEQVDEIAFARLSVEPRLAYLATSNIDEGDIERLENIDNRLNLAIEQGDIGQYLTSNDQFHTTLYDGANSDILASLARMLLLRIGPSLRVVCGRFGTLGLPDLHQKALAAMRAGDADAVSRAIKEDVKQGIAQVRKSMLQG